jgi:hypothetical protein
MNIFSLIGSIFKPAADLIDNIHTSEEERLEKKGDLLAIQAEVMSAALDFETKQLALRAEIVSAEAKSEHWVTATWRPIVMLSFSASVMAYWFGLTPELPAEAVDAMFTLVQIGVGGYVVGRSVEKVVPPIMSAMKERDVT